MTTFHTRNRLTRTVAIALLAAGTITVAPVQSTAQEWTRFRGPNGSGVAHTKTVPTKITDADVQWKISLPGEGHSSPVLWGDRIFLTSATENPDAIVVLCLSAKDGSERWRTNFPFKTSRRHRYNSPASSTPAVDANRVYVLWNEPEHHLLTALDHDGNVEWQRDFGPFVTQHGCGISPIVYQDKIILGSEQDGPNAGRGRSRTGKGGKSFITAVEAKTGKDVWRISRRSVVVAYSTPCIYQPQQGKPALIFNSQGHGIYAVDPDKGKVLWGYDQAFDKRSVSSPFIAGDVIFGSCGSGGGGNFVTAIKAGDATSGRAPELAYRIKKSAPYVPTGVVVGEHAWLWSDGGIVTCFNPATGSTHFQERVGGNYFGSPLWIDGRLFGVSASGEVTVVEASDKFNVLHRYPLNERCHSTPAVALGRLFIRTDKHLFCIGSR
jgi:outer membrane protein assembly factor BamB